MNNDGLERPSYMLKSIAVGFYGVLAWYWHCHRSNA
jgi:hypothetical protein